MNRFLANHATKSFPFVSTLRNCLKKSQFQWTKEVEQAFQEVKKCLTELPTLTPPRKVEKLLMYLSASAKAVGAVLLVDREKIQTPIYYVSRTLTDADTRYSIMEKMILALYKPKPAIKGQILADFIAEVPFEKEDECRAEEKPNVIIEEREAWLLFTDGASNDEGSGVGLKLIRPSKQEFTYAIRMDFKSTNNEAEYEAFLAGLHIAGKFGAQHVESHVDSMLIASQVNGSYEAKDEVMAYYLEQAQQMIRKFKSCNVKHIKRSENKSADALSKVAATSFEHLEKEVRVDTLAEPSIPERQVCIMQSPKESWMTPVKAYLAEVILPQEKVEAHKIRHKAMQYQMK
ncbi:uncharacterized protein LOC143597355 [Bidens hawaiensis]|uniref:uncharacterized protein LOC143597355 n=1 Tax=Bidens hawaiensis TaxID=980011 RepID=UPI00404A0911